jgi:hypothetical protein
VRVKVAISAQNGGGGERSVGRVLLGYVTEPMGVSKETHSDRLGQILPSLLNRQRAGVYRSRITEVVGHNQGAVNVRKPDHACHA